MKKKRFTEEQIVRALKEYENGRPTKDICRELGVSVTSFYYWKKKYGGMESKQVKELKALREENRKLKQMYADAALDIKALKDVLSKEW
jgi:putative transposase